MNFALVDLRTYTIAPRLMGEYVEVFQRLGLPVLRETLGNPLAFYTSLTGTLNQFVHLWGYQGMADYERRTALRDAHPAFKEYLVASKHLIAAQENRLLRFLPLAGMT